MKNLKSVICQLRYVYVDGSAKQITIRKTAANALLVCISTSVDVSGSLFSAPTLTDIGELVVTNVRELVVLKLPLIAPLVE